ncbi:ADP-glyceromanno-heptose 6-epimerase, partial [Candidatus Marinimicrobia bacterium MT.SAG.2]
GITDLLIVDHNPNGTKDANLNPLKYSQYVDKYDFIKPLLEGKYGDGIDAIIHLGACSDTTETDKEYLYKNNFEYTRKLAEFAVENRIRFIYASSAATYGNGENGYSDDESLIPTYEPLNEYARYKQMFDLWAIEEGIINKIVGLKYFNIFGPNEGHKGNMRSMVLKAYEQIFASGKVNLFKSHIADYEDGEQKRDFLYVKDAADMTLFFLDNPQLSGIYNIGSGKAETWNELIGSLFQSLDMEPKIEYIDMPDKIRDQYQYYTKADMTKFSKLNYSKTAMSLPDSVDDYVQGYLLSGKNIGE